MPPWLAKNQPEYILHRFADVYAEYKRLSTLGVQFPTGEPITYSFGIRNFYVANPEGNLLEIGSTSKTQLKSSSHHKAPVFAYSVLNNLSNPCALLSKYKTNQRKAKNGTGKIPLPIM